MKSILVVLVMVDEVAPVVLVVRAVTLDLGIGMVPAPLLVEAPVVIVARMGPMEQREKTELRSQCVSCAPTPFWEIVRALNRFRI